MKDIVVEIVSIIFGAFIVINRSQWSRKAIEFQNKKFGFHFGEKEVRATVFVYLLVGSAFIIMGILSIFGILEPKL